MINEIPRITPPELNGYVIYDLITGKFSKGGMGDNKEGNDGIWSSTPKIWRQLGHLKNHLQQRCLWIDYQNDIIYVDTIYVTSEVFSVKDNKPIDFNINEYLTNKAIEQKNEKHFKDFTIEYR